jgi:copper chaperone CopZ
VSEQKSMKKIDLATLEAAERNISVSKIRRVLIGLVVLVILAGGGYTAYSLIAGDVVASRFTVNKMNCPACVITVKEVTAKVPGVIEADVSLAAQDVTVKFRNKQTNPDQIREAIARAGYPAKVDGLFKPGSAGVGDRIVASVNGKPVFEKDVKVPLRVDDPSAKEASLGEAFFSTVGKDILLLAADSKMVVVQPYEMEAEVANIIQARGAQTEEFLKQMDAKFGSREKYLQVVGQRLGIRKLLDDHVLQDVKDPQERQRKTLEWVGNLFKSADVKILDPALKQQVLTAAGKEDWKIFWPRMISSDSQLKALLVP